MPFILVIFISLVIAGSPLMLAAVSSFSTGGGMFDENSSGVYIWYLFISLPLGALVLAVGLTIVTIRFFSKRSASKKLQGNA